MRHCQQQSQIKDVRTEPFTVVVAGQAHCFNLSRKNCLSWEIPNVMLSGSASTFPKVRGHSFPKQCLNAAGGTCTWPFLCNIGIIRWTVSTLEGPIGFAEIFVRHFNSRLLLLNTAFFPLSFHKSGQIFKWETLKDFVAQPPPPPTPLLIFTLPITPELHS